MISSTASLQLIDGAVSLIVADDPAARFMPVRYCNQPAALVVEFHARVVELQTSDWPVGIVGSVPFEKLLIAATTSELLPASDAIVPVGELEVPLFVVVAAPVWLAAWPVITATMTPHHADATERLHVTVIDALVVTTPRQIADCPCDDMLTATAESHVTAPPVFVGAFIVTAVPLSFVNATSSIAPSGGVNEAVVRVLALPLPNTGMGVLASSVIPPPAARISSTAIPLSWDGAVSLIVTGVPLSDVGELVPCTQCPVVEVPARNIVSELNTSV